MKDTCVSGNLSSKVVLVFTVALFLSGLARAQSKDFQIMVNGPWSYVLDPHREYDSLSQTPNENRIILVAPSEKHWVYFTSGPNPADMDHMKYSLKKDDPDLYYLDFPSSLQNHVGPEPNEEAAQLYKQAAPQSRIDTILNTPIVPRYAISLPMPDYISTYTGPYGSGFAESKVKMGRISYKHRPSAYTIWAVFHYSVDAQPPSLLIGVRKGSAVQQTGSIDVGNDGNRWAISITLMDPSKPNDPQCDALSGFSFAASTTMWDFHQRARFPVLKYKDDGTQYAGYYDYHCAEASQTSLDVLRQKINAIEKQQGKSKAAIEDLRCGLVSFLNLDDKTKGCKPRKVDPADLQTQLSVVRTNMEAFFPGKDKLPESIIHALSCIQELIVHKSCGQCCPNPQSVVDDDLGAHGLLMTATGSSDCHPPQMVINDAFSEILE